MKGINEAVRFEMIHCSWWMCSCFLLIISMATDEMSMFIISSYPSLTMSSDITIKLKTKKKTPSEALLASRKAVEVSYSNNAAIVRWHCG